MNINISFNTLKSLALFGMLSVVLFYKLSLAAKAGISVYTNEVNKLNNTKHAQELNGQDSINFMKKNNIVYEINIMYNNGVRAGNILDTKNKKISPSFTS
jgi:hypothetical protein